MVDFSGKEAITLGTEGNSFAIAHRPRPFSGGTGGKRCLSPGRSVSRWENGETVPNTETLKLLSRLYDVSINTLLGSPRKLVCQCCGMPLEDAILSHEPDGAINQGLLPVVLRRAGEFTYHDMESLVAFCETHMATPEWPAAQVRAHMEALLPQLLHWQKHSDENAQE